MQYTVSTKEFEGPLSLLLSMAIEKKIGIDRMSLANITDEYIEHIRKLPSIPTQSISTTIVIISTLILIKATSLIPQLNVSTQEEENIKELEDRLSAYSRIRKTARQIMNTFYMEPFFIRGRRIDTVEVFSPDKFCTKECLLEMTKGVIEEDKYEKEENEVFVEKRVEATISLEEIMQSLTDRVQNTIKEINFSTLRNESKNKLDIIISFLAVLELIKQGILNANQNGISGDIIIQKKT